MVVQGAFLTTGCDGEILIGFVIDIAQGDSVAGNRVICIYGVFTCEAPGCGVWSYEASFGYFIAVDAGT